MGIHNFHYYHYYQFYSLLSLQPNHYSSITSSSNQLPPLLPINSYYFTIIISHHSHVYSLNPSMPGCDAPTPPGSVDNANMLQPSEQDPVATDNEMEENGQDRDDVQPDLGWAWQAKANAGLKLLHSSELIAKLCGPLKKSNVRIVGNVCGHFDAPFGTPPVGIEIDELRVGMKRAAAKISRSQYEVYSFATRHDLSEAATEELLQIVGNVSTELNLGPLATKYRTCYKISDRDLELCQCC
jgi:hypothetical protein